MFTRILSKSLRKRKTKIILAILAVVIGASTATALLNISYDVTDKVSLQFSKYGANLLVTPHTDTIPVGFPGVDIGTVTDQRYINESDLWKIKTIYWRNNVLGFAPYLYQVVTATTPTTHQQIVLTGTYFNKTLDITTPYSPHDLPTFTTGVRQISPWWHLNGGWITDPNDTTNAMIGTTVATTLNLTIGQTFTITYQDQTTPKTSINLTVLGIITTNGNEDNQIFVNLPVAQTLTNRPGKIHTIQVSALCNACPVDTFAAEITTAIPGVDAKSVKQLVNVEMDLLTRIRSMMFLVTAVALFASALGVMTTMITGVIERQKEIGLMKSVGAENHQITALFLSEAAIIGIIGGLIGYLAGLLLAHLIGLSVFSVTISPHLEVLPIAIGLAIGVTLLSSIIPVRRAIHVEPAIVLRGE